MTPDLTPTDAPPEPANGLRAESDAGLLRQYHRNRDEAAFAELARRHVDLVYAAALRQSSSQPHLAEDITQAVFAELARHASRLTKHPALAGWLFTTTRQIALTTLRSERRRRLREHASLTMQPPSESADPAPHEPDWSQLGSILDEVLHELSERDRTAIVLRFFQSRRFEEVGQQLGLSANAARMRVDRALDRLRARLAGRGIVSTSVALATAMSASAVHAAPAGLSAWVSGAALAAAAGASIPTASSLITTLLSMKSKVILGGLAAAMVVVPIAWQHQDLNRLRRELADARAEHQLLVTAEAEARETAARSAAEVRQLRESQTELLRLRGEIGPLRDQVRAMARSASQAKPPPPPSNPTPKAAPGATELADVGAATPEHAASSLIWAVSSGRMDRLSDLLELPPNVAPADAPRHLAFFANQLSNVFRGMDFNGWKMDLGGTTNENIVRLQYGYRDLQTGNDETFAFHLHRLDSGWKIMVEGEVPEGF